MERPGADIFERWMRVLAVEDDELADVIESGLTEHAMDVVREATLSSGHRGRSSARSTSSSSM